MQSCDASSSVSPQRFSLWTASCSAAPALNWLAQRCDSQWQEARAHWASLWADHINYAKQQLKQEGGGQRAALFPWEINGRAGGAHRSQPAVSRDDRTRRSELRSGFLKIHGWRAETLSWITAFGEEGSVVARSSLLHEKNNMCFCGIYIQKLL